MRFPGSLLAMCGLLVAGLVSAGEVVISDLEYGIMGKHMRGLESGERLVTENPRIDRTTTIPARLGLRFGIRYKLTEESYLDKPVVKLLYLTPGITEPGTGRQMDKIELVQELSRESSYHQMAFQFSDPSEIKTGEWRFYIFSEDRKLAEQVFEVVPD